jgi:hypothetical protein
MYAFGILSLLLCTGLCFNLYSTQPNPNNLVIFNKKNLVIESNNKLFRYCLSLVEGQSGNAENSGNGENSPSCLLILFPFCRTQPLLGT